MWRAIPKVNSHETDWLKKIISLRLLEIHAVENTAEVKLPDVRNNMVDSGIVADGQLSFAESSKSLCVDVDTCYGRELSGKAWVTSRLYD